MPLETIHQKPPDQVCLGNLKLHPWMPEERGQIQANPRGPVCHEAGYVSRSGSPESGLRLRPVTGLCRRIEVASV